MKNVKKVICILMMSTFLISCVGIGLDTIIIKTEVPKRLVASFDAGVFRRPAPNITLDVTEVTRVGSNNTNMGSGNTIRKATVSGVPEVSGTYAAQALAGETAYWPVVIFSSSAAVNITGISFTGVTGISTSLTGSLSDTTYAKWEITGGTATAGTTIKATISYTYTWYNSYTGVNVTDDYTINGYSYVENIIFPATEWVFQARYQGGSGNAADVIYVQRLLGKGVYGDPIGLNVTSGDYLSGYFDVSTNLWVNDNDGTIPKRVGLKADPPRQDGGGGGSYANGTGAYPGDTHRIKTSVYLDISVQTLQTNNFRSHNYLQQAIRCSSGWQHYDAFRVKDGNVAYTNPGDQGDGNFGSISNDSGAVAALNPSGGTSSSTNLKSAGTEVTTTLFGNGGGTSVGSNEYTLLTKWKAKGKKNMIWDSDPYLCVYKGITIGITRFNKATIRSYLNYAIGTSTANTVTGSKNVTTIVTANGADPDNPGTATTFKGKNPQSWYYTSGWSDYSTAYDNAWSQIVKPNTNQTAIDSAAGDSSSGLYKAYISGLTLERANYTSLEELIAQVDAHETGNLIEWPDTAYYTTASANVLSEAYNAAVAARTASATGYNVLYQPYVDYLSKTLQDAINGLTYASYNLTFNANGGTGGTSGTLHYGDPVDVPTVTRVGYDFTGWAEGTPPATMPDYDITFTAQWQVYSYTVVFNGNGATGGSTAGMSFNYDETKALTANGFSKTGSTFAGWATTPGGGVSYTNTQSVSNLTAVNGATVTLYAVWTQNNYSYNFLANGGTGGTSGTLHYGDPVVVPTVTRTGYTFGFWAEGIPPATMPANNITFTAVWFVHTYTVTYNGNGADSGSTADSAHTYDIPKTLTGNGFVKTGYSFAGWATTPGGDALYTDSQSVINLTGEDGGTVTLYAKWSANDYSFTFDANGGTGGTSGTLHYGDPVVVPTVTRTGYTFVGWGEGVPPTTMPAESIRYSAAWTKNSYTVTYNGNGSTGGSTANSSHRYDTAKALTTNGFTRIGANFTGWSTTPGGAVQYTNGQSVLNLTAVPNGTVTLYAVWALIDYSYTFAANGGTGGTSGTLHYGDPVVVPNVTRTGYTFTGWAEGTPPATMPANDISYTAQWSINSYLITFDANGGTGGTGPDLMVYNSALSAPVVAKTGYTLAGWTPGVPAAVPAADTVYTAQWTANQYTVTFDANGGTGGTSGPLYYEDPLSAPAVERTGYTFAGWDPEVPATVPLNGGTYTAQWTANNYTVAYAANGGTGSMADSSHTYDIAKALTINGFARTGYTFAGWAVSPGGTAAYTNGQSVTNLTPLNGVTVTLYAKWMANTYTVTYSANSGTGTTADSLHTYDISSNLTVNGFAKTGHSFMGWAESDSGPAVYGDGEAVLNLTSDLNEIITFYAVWQLNEYSISFNSNGGSAVDTITQFYGTAVTPPENPVRTGYTFVNWLPEVPAAMPAADIECEAQWSVNSYHITFDSAGGSAVDTITQDYGTPVTAPEDPVKPGYTFAGWLPAVPGTMPAENTACTAHWIVNQYTVSFDSAGGSAVGSITQDYNSAVLAPADPARNGYTFAGWQPEVPAVMPAANTVCVAQWTANSYTITFNANGGTGGTVESLPYDSPLSAPAVEKTGYTFIGWDPEVPAAVPAADTEYTALWTANTYTIIYNPNGGTGTTADSLHTYDTAANLTANQFTRIGYKWKGWDLDSGSSSASFADEQAVINMTATAGGTVTLYAVWEINRYTVSFDPAGGSAVGSITQDYNTSVTAPADPAREGYTFAGWSPAVPAVMPAEDTLCTAQWTVRQFTVSFDSAGGSAVAAITQDYATAIIAPAAPAKTGYTFAGWSPAVPAVMPAEDTLCTAQWTVNGYTVTFDAQGGAVAPASIGVTYAETYGELPVPAKVGYIFGGWFTGTDGTGTQVTGATTVTITEDQTLYAKWSIGSFNITFNANGGTGGTGPIPMVFGEILAAPLVTREGYVFAGWQPSVPASVPGADTVYTAQWIRTAVTVTKTESGMVVNIQGWTADSQYQIWSYQQITSDALLGSDADVQADQWILAMPYAPGSAGAVQPDGSILFTIPDFDSPTPNYTIAVRVLDAGGNFTQELRDAYTPEDVQEAVITKVLVDGAVTTGYELREITGGAETLIKVIGNNVDNLVYSAAQIAGQTEVGLTVSNTNEFLWDISALELGIYTIRLTATNGTTTAVRDITFELFSLSTSIDYGSIDDMTLSYNAGVVSITPTFANGTFSYRLGEPNHPSIYRSVEYSDAGTFQYAITAPGVYNVSGYVTRAGLIGTEGSFDDGLVRTLVIPREGGGSASMTFTANQTLPDVAKGTPIIFTAAATGLPDTIEYSFWRYDATGYVLVKDWSTNNTLNWTPARVGEYSFEVRAKGAGAGSYELKKTLVVNITDTVQETAAVTSITLNDAYLNANAQGKKPIMLQASAVSANGNDLMYKFRIYDDDMRGGTLQGYSVNQHCVWTPREAGTFTISVLVKNSDSFGRYDAIQTFDVTVD